MANGVDGVLGGTTTHDAMLWYVTKLLPKYENDTVVVEAMKEACHHNLYAIANSCGMNGVGPNTKIKVLVPDIITTVNMISKITIVTTIAFAALWVMNMNKFKKTENYMNYKTYKAEQKALKIQK